MTPRERYHEWLRSPEWRTIAERVKARADYTCRRCGDRSPHLIVHHGTYELGWKPPDDLGLVCLCVRCHYWIHGHGVLDPRWSLEEIDEYLRRKMSVQNL